jgi:DNA (cytosine-5)-methyltransferase 1
MSNFPSAIDLFCGCGGLSTGLLDAGVAVKGGFDIDKRSIEAYNYNHNHRGAKGFQVDLAQSTGAELLEMLNLDSLDLLVGGAPCQAFSIVGARKGLDDPRGKLVFDFVRYVSELQPKVFILENVPNIRKISDGQVFDCLIKELSHLGYELSYSVLSAADYGVPQNRKRMFIVGAHNRKVMGFPPEPTHYSPDSLHAAAGKLTHITCRDALDDLPDVESSEAELIPNHENTVHAETVLSALAMLEPGKRDKKYFYDRLHPDKPSYTLRSGSGNFTPLRPIHYQYHRVVSVRESARLQGFTDDFIWTDSIPRLQQYRQVGNAVCPPVAAALGAFVCDLMGWQRDPVLFRGDPSVRSSPFTKTKAEKTVARMQRIRGASLGILQQTTITSAVLPIVPILR